MTGIRKGALALVCSLLFSTASSAATLSLESATPNIFVGDTLFVDLVVGGLDPGGPEGPLGAFDANVVQAPIHLGFGSWTLGTRLGDPLFDAIDGSFGDLGGGTANVAETSFLSDADLIALQSPSFTLATLQYTGLTPGVTGLSIGAAVLSDSLGLFPIDITSTTGLQVTVNARQVQLPEPAALALMLAGGLVAVRVGRRRGGVKR